MVRISRRADQGDVNVAVTVFAALIVTTQAPVPVHAPDQPLKLEPLLTVAVKVTTVRDA